MLKPKDIASRLNVSVGTLQRWDNEGILTAQRTPTNRRYYTEDQIRKFLHPAETVCRMKIAYARVSNAGQKEDLKNQVTFLRDYVNNKGEILDDVLTDIGSGLNYKRKKWNDLLELVMEAKVDTIYITHKDRFVRFGYDWFEQLCLKFNTKIVILNNPDLSPQQEMVEDLVSIIHMCSAAAFMG